MGLELNSIDSAVVECLNYATGRVKQCAKHSIHHLERSWEIKDVDPEMAAFRSITAEEEAATALFIAIKEKHYPNAVKLKFRDHRFKAAIHPFLMAVAKLLGELEPFPSEPQLAATMRNNKRVLELRLKLSDGRVLKPEPPLGFNIFLNEQGIPYQFDKQLEELASGIGKDNALSYIEELANLRNLLLYASTDGIPRLLDDIDQILFSQQSKVFILLKILCLIFPYRERALFVEQCVNAFLVMMGKMEPAINETSDVISE